MQVKLCDPRLSALSVVATIKALYKYTSFLSFSFFINQPRRPLTGLPKVRGCVPRTQHPSVNKTFSRGGYWTTRGCHRRLCVLSFPFWRHLRDRELSSYRRGKLVNRQICSSLVGHLQECSVTGALSPEQRQVPSITASSCPMSLLCVHRTKVKYWRYPPG